MIRVPAGLRDELGHYAGPRHVRGVGACRHRDFLHRAVVVVEAGGVGALGVDDALDHRPVLIRLRVVGGIAGLRARGAAAHIDALHLYGGRGGQRLRP